MNTNLLLFAWLLLGALLIGPVSALAADNGDPASTKKQIKQVKQQIDTLQSRIKKNRDKYSAEEKALKEAEKAVSEVAAQLQKTTQEQKQTEIKLAELEQQKLDINSELEQQKAALLQDIRAAYRSGRQEYLKLLLNQQDPQELARQLKYYDYFHQARLGRIDQFNETLAQLATTEQQIVDEQERLESLSEQLNEQKQELETAYEEKQAILTKLAKTIQSNETKVKSLKDNQRELEKVLKAIQEALNDLPANLGNHPFDKLQGKLPWPSPGKLAHSFGSPREEGKLHWNGVLIQAQSGTPVKAIHYGRVVFSDWMRGFGMLTIIDHGNGYLSLYGHNEALSKAPGDWVSPGEIIAYSGNSGGQTSAGLYFEIRKNGKPLDPTAWCRR